MHKQTISYLIANVFLDGHFKELCILDADPAKGEVAGENTLVPRVKVGTAFFVHYLREPDHFPVTIQDGQRQQRSGLVAGHFVYILIESRVLQKTGHTCTTILILWK